MTMKTSTIKRLDNLIDRYNALSPLREQITEAVTILCECSRSNGKVLVCGNGGSAADSEHIVGELMKGFVLPRPVPQADIETMRVSGIEDWADLAMNLQQGIMAISLNGHLSLSTAVLNDNDPYMAFAQQVYVYGQPNDVLIGLSTSGNSRNVVNAMKVAKAFGLRTIGFMGEKTSVMDRYSDALIKVPERETYKVQEYHLPVYHTICLMLENEIFGEE
ncbi:MAG: D-sedoheptulose-7-phosphate isomerase [Armatimonadota bacterium]